MNMPPRRGDTNELVVAWDIETCPQPLDTLSPCQRRRHALLLDGERRRHPEAPPEEACRRVRSLHPMLGWICCVSDARLGSGDVPAAPKSYTAAAPAEESVLLRAFWADLARLPRRVRFVTFNGKHFDADWLRVRTAAHDLMPTRLDVLDSYPYRHRPHADLARAFGCVCSLDDLADLLGVNSAPEAVSAETVADAVAAGRLPDVVRYCEADVRTTLACYVRLREWL